MSRGREVPVARAGVVGTALAATLLAGVVGAPGVEAQDDRTWLFGEVSFPARVDSFVVRGTERWSRPEQGTLLRYRTDLAPGANIDVHVQPLPGRRGDPEVVRGEFQRTLDELRRPPGEGVSVVVDTVHTVSVEAGGWTYEGHVARARVRQGGTAGLSFAYVFAKPPSFVKIHITHAAGAQSELEPRIRAFVAGILDRLDSFQNRGPPGGS